MAKGMAKGHKGHDNKPRLSTKEKRLKKQKKQHPITTPTV